MKEFAMDKIQWFILEGEEGFYYSRYPQTDEENYVFNKQGSIS